MHPYNRWECVFALLLGLIPPSPRLTRTCRRVCRVDNPLSHQSIWVDPDDGVQVRARGTDRRAVVRLPAFAEFCRSGVMRNLSEGVLLATISKNLSRYDARDNLAVT